MGRKPKITGVTPKIPQGNALTDSLTQIKLELARRSFWEFCKLMAPDFYKEDRPYLKNICDQLQAFHDSPTERVMVINCPPRHGKSRTAQLFSQWAFGKNPAEKIITGSYNEQLSTTFSRAVRDGINERKVTKSRIVYSDVFPDVRIKRGSSAANMWTLEGQHISYLATSPSGTVTGFGATLMVIDDIVKNAEEAYNETVLENHWAWYTNTMLSRLEAGGKQVIIATRWHTDDLSGRVISHYKNIGESVRLITYRALQTDDTMLCPAILDRKTYDMLSKTIGKDIVEANYNQVPVDLVGRLYQGFKTYTSLPVDENGNSLFQGIYAYCDVADTGDDYLCNIIYGWYDEQAYVLDVYYTQDNMIITEPELAKRYWDFKVDRAWVESNNGGRGFGRSIERILREKYHSTRPMIELFYQSKNKAARILGAATWVQANVLFPVDWQVKFPDFYDHIYRFQKEIKGNKHDDAPDALTGIYEKSGRPNVFSFN